MHLRPDLLLRPALLLPLDLLLRPLDTATDGLDIVGRGSRSTQESVDGIRYVVLLGLFRTFRIVVDGADIPDHVTLALLLHDEHMRGTRCTERFRRLLRRIVQIREGEFLFCCALDHVRIGIVRNDVRVVRVDSHDGISLGCEGVVKFDDTVFVRDGIRTMIAGEDDDVPFDIGTRRHAEILAIDIEKGEIGGYIAYLITTAREGGDAEDECREDGEKCFHS